MIKTPGSSEDSSESRPASTTGRKQLPQIPDHDTQLSLANKMIDKKTSTPRGNHSYGPFFFEYSLMAEYNQLQKQLLPGIYVIPSAKSALVWNGVLFIRQGRYQGGVFKYTVSIPENYPDGDCPRLFFEPVVFHPLVDPDTGELAVKRAFPKWRRNVHHIWQVLMYARRIFHKFDGKDAINTEAATLLDQDIETFGCKVAESIAKCKASLYDPSSSDDSHAVRFSEWKEETHRPKLEEMLHAKVKRGESKDS